MLLSELLSDKRIELNVSVDSWQAALDVGGAMLIDDGSIEVSYIEAVKAIKEEHGPYIVMAPGIALSHARPEDGVNRTAMSLITLEEPVRFGHDTNDPVKLIITMATTDNQTHLESLKQLMSVMMDEADMEKLINATDKATVLEIIERHSEGGVVC